MPDAVEPGALLVVQARVTLETRRAELLVIEGKLHASFVAQEH